MNFRRIIPAFLENRLKKIILRFRIYTVKKNHRALVYKVKNKPKRKIAFLLINEAIWKYERLYFLLKADKRYDPVVFICPFLRYGEKIMHDEMEAIYDRFITKGYGVQKTLREDRTYVDIKKEFQPDVVFFSTPWGYTRPEYQIRNFLDTLTCYVPYGFNSAMNHYYSKETQTLCWRVFVETAYHKKMAKKYSPRQGDNFFVTGFPGTDNLIDENYRPKKVWKPQIHKKKRIIWAPHHSISGVAGRHIYHSTFLLLADFMLEVARKYENKIQICFKPHPNLKGKLSLPEMWGEEKTEKYYNEWRTLKNGQLNEGDYTDLFLNSDAMIHDCGSFLIEYLMVDKPTLYLLDNLDKNQLNDLGREGLKVMNRGYDKRDVISFIEDVVIGEKDQFERRRKEFVKRRILPPNRTLASINIYNHLNKEFNYGN